MITWSCIDDVYEVALSQEPCNEIGLEVVSALEKLLDEVERSNAHALVLHSTEARGFCAGADLRQLHASIAGRTASEYMPELAAFLKRVHSVMDRLDALSLTTVGALHGVCFGGGFELALVCDVLVADRSTRFGFPELRLGLIPGFGGVPRLRRELPNAVIRDLLFTGRSLNAKRAHELGLVSQLVAPGQALAVARDVARQAALFSPAARGRAKAFAKPIPREELEEEQRVFLSMFASGEAERALAEFVARTDPMPYLPQAAAAVETRNS